MLFNSLEFCLVFLPFIFLGLVFFGQNQTRYIAFLIFASIVFYSYWNWRHTFLLAVSIVVNWLVASLFIATQRRWIPAVAIAANLAVLALFKYLGFFAGLLPLGANTLPALALPLGISFFTFHHIIYHADLMRGNAPKYSFRDYALYIILFPQILAGPLVRHNEIIRQFARDPWRAGWEQRWLQGLFLFAAGLAKKLFLADLLAEQTNSTFAQAATGAVTILDAWSGVLSFTFQIYFDFSGYSDMAIGMALILGFTLPENFNAPYRAASINDFWRRWHMTLSRFLRDYLYIPFGGNRYGLKVQCAALLATMALGGLWHGAGWTFVIWGVLHGVALVVAVCWRAVGRHMPSAAGWLLTFAFVSVAWVFFRAADFPSAFRLLEAMVGRGELGAAARWQYIAAAAAIALVGPTSQELARRLTPHNIVGVAVGTALATLLLKIANGVPYEFIYFQF